MAMVFTLRKIRVALSEFIKNGGTVVSVIDSLRDPILRLP